MEHLNDLLSKLEVWDQNNIINSENLKKLILDYSTNINLKEDNYVNYFEENTLNWWLMKYFYGSITEDEHYNFKNSEYSNEEEIKNEIKNIVLIYDIIFGICEDNWIESLNEGFINEVTDLWLINPNNFKYQYQFKKLIFMIYAEHGTPKLRHIALEFHKQYKADVQINSLVEDNELFLINLPNHNDYNAKYGIKKL